MLSNNELFEELKFFEWLTHTCQRQENVNCHDYWQDARRGQGRILFILNLEDNLSTKELSYRLGIRTSSLNEILAKLEKNNLITRKPNKDDRRVILNSLTPLGREKIPRPIDLDFFNCLTDQEKEDLNKIILKLNNCLEEQIMNSENVELIQRCQKRKEFSKKLARK